MYLISDVTTEPCIQVEDSSQKHYISSKSIMKACRVEKERGHLWYLTQSVCGILFLNWCQVETKSVIGLAHWIHLGEDTPICSKSFCCTFKKKKLFCPETCCAVAGTSAGCVQWIKWRERTLKRIPLLRFSLCWKGKTVLVLEIVLFRSD